MEEDDSSLLFVTIAVGTVVLGRMNAIDDGVRMETSEHAVVAVNGILFV